MLPDAEPPDEDVIKATKPAAFTLLSETNSMVALPDSMVTMLACGPLRLCRGLPKAEVPL